MPRVVAGFEPAQRSVVRGATPRRLGKNVLATQHGKRGTFHADPTGPWRGGGSDARSPPGASSAGRLIRDWAACSAMCWRRAGGGPVSTLRVMVTPGWAFSPWSVEMLLRASCVDATCLAWGCSLGAIADWSVSPSRGGDVVYGEARTIGRRPPAPRRVRSHYDLARDATAGAPDAHTAHTQT